MSAVQDRVWTDPELADLLRDDPRLVAIADALRESGGVVVQRRRRRRILRGALMAAALCVAVAVALVAPWSNSGNGSLADRALAVIGTQPVLHVVVELAPQGQLIDLKTGTAAPLSEQREIWYDGDRALEHTVYRAGGVVVWDQLETPQGKCRPPARTHFRAGSRRLSRPSKASSTAIARRSPAAPRSRPAKGASRVWRSSGSRSRSRAVTAKRSPSPRTAAGPCS